MLRVKPTGEIEQLALPPALEGKSRWRGAAAWPSQPDGTVYFTRLGELQLLAHRTGRHPRTAAAPKRGLGALRQDPNAARHVAIDRRGNVFVSGFGSHKVYRLDAEALAASP